MTCKYPKSWNKTTINQLNFNQQFQLNLKFISSVQGTSLKIVSFEKWHKNNAALALTIECFSVETVGNQLC